MSTIARYLPVLKQKIEETREVFEGYLSDPDILRACEKIENPGKIFEEDLDKNKKGR